MLTTIKVVGIGSATDFPIPDAHDSTQVERGHEPGSHADLAEASVNNEFRHVTDELTRALHLTDLAADAEAAIGGRSGVSSDSAA